MTRDDFKPDTRYTLACRDESGRARPLNVYVYRVYDKFMVAREAGGSGLLRRIGYESVERIVHEHVVPPAERFFIPGAVLDEKNWRDRREMQLYASAPGRGK